MVHTHVASVNPDRNVRVDLATLVGVGLAALALYAAARNFSLIGLLLEMPYVGGADVLFSTPEVLTGLLVPAIALVVLALALGYAVVFDRRSVALVALCTIGLLYWSAGIVFAAVGIGLAGAFALLTVVSSRARTGRR